MDFGGTVDTLEFNAIDRSALWHAIQSEVEEAIGLVREGICEQDPWIVGRGASISALASQKVMYKPKLSEVIEFAETANAAGVNVGHSGTIMGVLLDARERRGKAVFHMARDAFPDAEQIHHFRLIGGGVRHMEVGS